MIVELKADETLTEMKRKYIKEIYFITLSKYIF